MKLDDDIHNYYEHLVLEKLDALNLSKSKTNDYIADLTCLVLNQLPPRYIRHEVDMAFYLPISERQQMEMNVGQAVKSALEYLDANPKQKPKGKAKQ
ncbi:late competence development ComFB family protein [Ningiella sp. W23]|uniref:late competence development ComFB family protein n=1 Tax=Ningiella sp. W23 TaxID=3023715 RepID=UPI00375644D3